MVRQEESLLVKPCWPEFVLARCIHNGCTMAGICFSGAGAAYSCGRPLCHMGLLSIVRGTGFRIPRGREVPMEAVSRHGRRGLTQDRLRNTAKTKQTFAFLQTLDNQFPGIQRGTTRGITRGITKGITRGTTRRTTKLRALSLCHRR